MKIAWLLLLGIPSLGTCQQWGWQEGCEPPLKRYEYSEIHMGVRVDLKFFAEDPKQAAFAAKAAFARFAELEQILSDYRPDSEVMKLCGRAGEGPIPVSRELFTVLQRAKEVAEASEGAFDFTCGPLIRLWRDTRKTGVPPTAQSLEEARKLVGWQKVGLNERDRTVRIGLKGLQIDFGGIGKGYACDQAIAALKRKGVLRALVVAGGDMVASGAPPGERGWRIEVADADNEAYFLANRALSVSGDTEQFVVIDGKRYSHIVDPRTGWGLTNRIQVTVLGPNGLTTDPIATALCVLGEEQSEALRKKYRVETRFRTARSSL